MAPDRDGLLSEKHYDEDATLALSDDSGFESEGELAGVDPVKDDDRDILDETEAHEKLLRKPGRLDAARAAFGLRDGTSSKRRKDKPKKSKRTGKDSSDMMMEMEGGFKDTSSQSSTDSEIEGTKWDRKAPKQSHRGRLTVIYLSIVALFVALIFGAYKASRKHISPSNVHPPTLFNGTHTFRPTTILVSLDGFRADFLNRNLTPALSAFIASGVSPKYLLPSFPSVTFPNHFTLVTGLYPESHGIVSNQFWDPDYEEEFYYTHVESSMQAKWWDAEPLWVTAEDQGVRSAIHMWPGSEAHIPDVEPTFMDKYNGTEDLLRKVDRVLGWLDLPGDDDGGEGLAHNEKRPQFIAAYVPNVDADGHKYGPNSTEIKATIADVDSMFIELVEGLYARNLSDIVNLVVVSDHGMATTSNDRLIQLDDLMDVSLIDHIDGWPLRGLRLKNPDRDVPILYEQLSKEAEKAGSFDVYTLDTMPERYHFTNNDRIAPLWVVPKTGWAVVEKANFDVADAIATGKEFSPKGLHGYDHEHPLMRAIFIARGPAFPHEPNSRLPVFQNTEVYNIVCDSLGIEPHPNNGTLRLPLTTEGLHSDANDPGLETPADPVEHEHVDEEVPESTPLEDAVDATPGAEDSSSDNDGKGTEEGKGKWWKFVHEQLEKAKEWAKEFIESIRGNKKGQSDDPV
ncbi:hypothetical protein PV11_05871 [Exophiala sideris]|uniref:Phosphodiest-domain-containing protein n=1 Tax=Exophiala sideris TaxID=1016849 RepID=A0A0D1YR63_9EURO|nr:hypothetical protein PV11_05871 [Exophiala sideris]